MEVNEEVINRITEVRKHNGLSINKLADKCGVNSANLSRSLAGKATLSDRVVYKIAHALNVSLDWLEHGIGPMMSPTVASAKELEVLDSSTSPMQVISGSNIHHNGNIAGDAALWKKLYEDKAQELDKANKRIDQLLAIIERTKI